MSIVRLLPAWFHAIADYAVGAPPHRRGPRRRRRRPRPSPPAWSSARPSLAVERAHQVPARDQAGVLPFTVHSAGDYLSGPRSSSSPPSPSTSTDGDGGLSAFYVVAGVAVLAVSLVTNYQYGPKRSWDAVGPQAAAA